MSSVDSDPLRIYPVVGIVVAICGNILISVALNIQRYAHVRLDRRKRWQHGDTGNDRELSSSFIGDGIWWLGVVIMTVGETGNFLAYGIAPPSVVSPLGVFALLSNCVIAPVFFHEKLKRRDIIGVAISIVGILLVIFSVQQPDDPVVQDPLAVIYDVIHQLSFRIYGLVTVGLMLVLLFILPVMGRQGDSDSEINRRKLYGKGKIKHSLKAQNSQLDESISESLLDNSTESDVEGDYGEAIVRGSSSFGVGESSGGEGGTSSGTGAGTGSRAGTFREASGSTSNTGFSSHSSSLSQTHAHAKPTKNLWVLFGNISLVALLGAYTALSTKCLSSLLRYNLPRALTLKATYILTFVVISTAALQVLFLNRALKHFPSTLVIPVHFLFFTISVIVGSELVFHDFDDDYDFAHSVMFSIGCIFTFIGVWLIASVTTSTNVYSASISNEDGESINNEVISNIIPINEGYNSVHASPRGNLYQEFEETDTDRTPLLEDYSGRSPYRNHFHPHISSHDHHSQTRNSLSHSWETSHESIPFALTAPGVYIGQVLNSKRSIVELFDNEEIDSSAAFVTSSKNDNTSKSPRK